MEIRKNTDKIKRFARGFETYILTKLRNRKIRLNKIKFKGTFQKVQFNLNNIKRNSIRIFNQNKHKKSFTYVGGGALILMLIFIFNIALNASMLAYEVRVEDRVIAVVREEEDFKVAVEDLKEEVWLEYKQEFALPENISFETTKARNGRLTDTNEIIRNLKSQLDFNVKATAITVNGQEVAIVNNRDIAKAILEEIKEPFVKEDVQYESIDFTQRVEIEDVAVEIASIRDKDEATTYILNGTDEEKLHEVESGENSWTIARRYNITVADIEKANPDISADRLQIGQEISLVVPKPYITVLTKEYVELVENIPFDTETVQSDSLYRGDKKITVQGTEGEREIKGYIVRENGIEVDREIVNENILSEPRTRVVAEGTRPRPATVATGSFSNPTRGRLTSGFGMRWGRHHSGIDVAAPTGTPITAADAGRVSFAGWSGAYGNLIIIDHENGYQTYYAHCNRLQVSVGQRVFKGQQIATVGSTGNSTGPHLHFEVRRNGTPINPSQFVRY